MLRFFSISRIRMRIGITAVDYVDFKKIDSKIKHDGQWTQVYPKQTGILIPKERAEEIIAKLKLHDGITAINGDLTPRGVMIEAELKKHFERARPPSK